MKIVVDFRYKRTGEPEAFGREVLLDAEQRLGVNSLRELGEKAVKMSAIVGIRRYIIDEVKLCEDDGTERAKYTGGKISHIMR